MYPDPAVDNITIEASQNVIIKITNIQGQLIKIFNSTGNKTNIDVSAFARGVYIIRIDTGKEIMVRKFVKV
jgi:hypothetical protein